MMDIGIALVAPGGYVGKTQHHRVTRLRTMLLHVSMHIAWAVSLQCRHIIIIIIIVKHIVPMMQWKKNYHMLVTIPTFNFVWCN